jgi:hypothetical protein
VKVNEKNCRLVVKGRSGDRCEICGHSGMQMHHRKNRSQGGLWEPSNILHVCVACHGFVTEHPAAAYCEGWSVRSYEDPASVSLSMYGGHRWLLRDNGERVPAPIQGLAS